MSNILYPAGLYRTRWSEENYGEQPSFKYLVLSAEVEGIKCYDVASMHKLIENLKKQRITNPFIVYSGIHLPECNVGALRRHDLESPHLIRIMKDVRDWPIQAVISLLVEKEISQLLLENEVLGQGSIKDINFEKVVRHLGFAAAIGRKRKGLRGGIVSTRPKKLKRAKPKVKVNYAPPARDNPDALVWSEEVKSYIKADSDEGRAVLERRHSQGQGERRDPEELQEEPLDHEELVNMDPEELVTMDPERLAAKLGKYMHEHIAERKTDRKKFSWPTPSQLATKVAGVQRDETFADEQRGRSAWESAYKAAVVEDEAKLTPKQRHLMAALDIALEEDEIEEVEQDENPEDADGFEDAYDDEEVEVDW